MGAQWLIKSEPSTYSYARLVEEGRTTWDGIRNFEARNNLRAMKAGDLALFYHSGDGKEVVGIARVVREAYPDASTKEDWSVVDIEPVCALAVPVRLAALRAGAKTKDMAILKKTRLSVSPVTKGELAAVLAMGKTKVKA
jgi:predicted RNA-binding protein with PUA-like domain